MTGPPSLPSARGTPSPGDVLRGKYRVERVLGAGGMGVVVLAHHLRLDRPVAIKLLRPNPGEPHAPERFAREARAAARLQSDHVVRILDVDDSESGQPFIVMEYLDGTDLERLVKQRGGGLPVAEAVDYLLQTCEGVADVHAAGIIHRDLKPSNLFLVHRRDGSPCVKLVDFGISKPLESVDEMALTDTEWIVGSPMYMAPEQLRHGRDVDLRTDVWALGLVLFRLLTGKHAFEAASRPAVILRIASEEPTPLLGLRPDAPPELESVILRCLAKDRAARFPRVEDLAAALEPFGPPPRVIAPRALSSGNMVAPRPLPSSSVEEIETVSASGPLGSTTGAQVSHASAATRPPRSPWVVVAVGIGAGVAAAVVGTGVWRMSRTTEIDVQPAVAPAAAESTQGTASTSQPPTTPGAPANPPQASASVGPSPHPSTSTAAPATPGQGTRPSPSRRAATPASASPTPAEPRDPLDIGLK